MKNTNRDIENEFVVVYCVQRGAGKSYSKNVPFESMNVDQFISDTKDLSALLIKRYQKNKIYLMGHSWGSLLGIITAYENPGLYHAYLGVGQVCHQYRSERISWIGFWIRPKKRE